MAVLRIEADRFPEKEGQNYCFFLNNPNISCICAQKVVTLPPDRAEMPKVPLQTDKEREKQIVYIAIARLSGGAGGVPLAGP